jgi:hypothetical protein
MRTSVPAVAVLLVSLSSTAMAQTANMTAGELAAERAAQRAREAAKQDGDEQRARALAEFREMIASRVPLQVQVVVARYQGDKRISSLPYLLAPNANDTEPTRLRMGARVPVPTLSGHQQAAQQLQIPMPAISPITYQEIGTNVDCKVQGLIDGLYEVTISVEDNSIAPTPEGATSSGEPPVFRTFQASNTLLLKDGQTRQFTAATDRVTGEVVRIEVTLTVVK